MIASELIFMELLPRPVREGRRELVADYLEIVQRTPRITLAPVGGTEAIGLTALADARPQPPPDAPTAQMRRRPRRLGEGAAMPGGGLPRR